MDIDTSDLDLSHLQTTSDKNKVQVRIMDSLQFRIQQAINLKDDEINRLRDEISILQNKIIYRRNATTHDFTAKSNSKMKIQNKIFKSRKDTSTIITDMKKKHSKRLNEMMKEYNERIDKMRKRLEEVIQNRSTSSITNSSGENNITKKIDKFLESLADEPYNREERVNNRLIEIESQKKVLEEHHKKMSEYEAKLQNNREKERELSYQVAKLKSELSIAKAQKDKMELDMVETKSSSSKDTKKSPISMINSDQHSISGIEANQNRISSHSPFVTPLIKEMKSMRDIHDRQQDLSGTPSQHVPSGSPSLQNSTRNSAYADGDHDNGTNYSEEVDYSSTSSDLEDEQRINDMLNELQKNYENNVKTLEKNHKKEVKSLMKQIRECQKQIIKADPLAETDGNVESDTKQFTTLNSIMASFDGMSREEKEITRKRLLCENKHLKQEIGRLDFMIYGRSGKYKEWRNLH